MYVDIEGPAGGGQAGRLELLHEEAAGTPRGAPPLLFVHGAFLGAWCWRVHYLPYFAERGYDAYAVSLRGHGGSGGRDEVATASLSDYADDLAEAVAAFDEPPVLIGHSMGGAVVDLALRRGVAASAAVFLATVPPTGLAPVGTQLMLTRPRLLWELGVLQGLGPGWVDIDEAQRLLFAQGLSPEALLEYTGRMQPESQLALAEMGMPRWPQWRGVEVPVAVIGAEADLLIPPWLVRTTAWLYGVRPRWIPHAGHAAMLEPQWQRGAEVVAEALGELILQR
ncbi:alpha/beta hydrolase [Halorhodospira neutriphila]|uniref:AB hydrolase-1 domain-containing protein n=1 Tax=Halorhodospira neutriphila TaxID=168379 RepID=A0ABS1E3L4_9GAMM|nr:alpha/beta fold hydrolase [Halorhodospira neutriphila]MBK1726098.1 hypothetical protein [Halorhodospira neutriphila]